MVKVMIDCGHGGSDPGAVGNGPWGTVVEKDNALKMGLIVRDHLTRNFNNVEVLMTRSNDSTQSLSSRTNLANTRKVDFFFSIHQNASGTGASGYEDFVHNSLSNSSTSAKRRDIIHQEVINRVLTPYGIWNRGKKKANFHVLRETNMSSMLVETLFVDSSTDQKLIKGTSILNDFAVAYAEGIAKAFNLTRKSTPPQPKPTATSGTLWKVQVGSFQHRQNAEDREDALKEKGFDSFIFFDNALWKVQSGAFKDKSGAESRVKDLEKSGFDAFVFAD